MQLSVDLDEDAGVTAAHDQQRNHVQRHEMKHVVRRLLPALLETAVRDALSEVLALRFDGPEDEQLQEEANSDSPAVFFMHRSVLSSILSSFRLVERKLCVCETCGDAISALRIQAVSSILLFLRWALSESSGRRMA